MQSRLCAIQSFGEATFDHGLQAKLTCRQEIRSNDKKARTTLREYATGKYLFTPHM